jgi:5-(carboxyamino)imidazole ribonucleotide synthase
MIAPGGVIGILGGGQLGRMLSMAAAQLGYRCHIFAPEAQSPAADVAAAITQAGYDDAAALAAFAAAIDVVTYEFENVPVAAAARLATAKPVFPPPAALSIAQDRLTEKQFAQSLGLGTAPFAPVDSLADLEQAVAQLGRPSILKTRRLGYDGKGQVLIDANQDLAQAWQAVRGAPCVLEGFVAFEREVSVLVARGQDGAVRCYGPVENEHSGGILRVSRAPAGVSADQAEAAMHAAQKLADALGYVGVLGVEMFVTRQGVLINEIAPRVHNSGHWTIEGAVISQFENHIRAVCGLPLGSTALTGRVEMHNLIGDDLDGVPALLADPDAHVHLYGKGEARPGRKMGHVTWVREA